MLDKMHFGNLKKVIFLYFLEKELMKSIRFY